MSSIIKSVEKDSPAFAAEIKANDVLLKINGHDIVDVLDYRFYQVDSVVKLTLLRDGLEFEVTIEKDEADDLGLEFETYLMDKQRSCRNNCIFCFIDQMPKGMRESLYFKDDDSRLSFLFGNYITLTNITEHEIERIEKMHISPVNISVHTTNPELRVAMLRNRFAGEALKVLYRLCDAGIQINCQIVLVPGVNDKGELERTLADLTSRENIGCIAIVPVGLTGHRDGLYDIKPFDKDSALDALRIIDRFGDVCIEKYGDRRVYAADEFYLISGREIPSAEYYGDFLQLENGVGMWALFQAEADDELDFAEPNAKARRISAVTGEASARLIKATADKIRDRYNNIHCEVYPIKNEFFGGKITVTGLITGQDIVSQLKDKDLGDELIIPDVCLRHGTNVFLDDMTVSDIEEKLKVKVRICGSGGADFVDAVLDFLV